MERRRAAGPCMERQRAVGVGMERWGRPWSAGGLQERPWSAGGLQGRCSSTGGLQGRCSSTGGLQGRCSSTGGLHGRCSSTGGLQGLASWGQARRRGGPQGELEGRRGELHSQIVKGGLLDGVVGGTWLAGGGPPGWCSGGHLLALQVLTAWTQRMWYNGQPEWLGMHSFCLSFEGVCKHWCELEGHGAPLTD